MGPPRSRLRAVCAGRTPRCHVSAEAGRLVVAGTWRCAGLAVVVLEKRDFPRFIWGESCYDVVEGSMISVDPAVEELQASTAAAFSGGERRRGELQIRTRPRRAPVRFSRTSRDIDHGCSSTRRARRHVAGMAREASRDGRPATPRRAPAVAADERDGGKGGGGW